MSMNKPFQSHHRKKEEKKKREGREEREEERKGEGYNAFTPDLMNVVVGDDVMDVELAFRFQLIASKSVNESERREIRDITK